jgi:hypothetical protein
MEIADFQTTGVQRYEPVPPAVKSCFTTRYKKDTSLRAATLFHFFFLLTVLAIFHAPICVDAHGP